MCTIDVYLGWHPENVRSGSYRYAYIYMARFVYRLLGVYVFFLFSGVQVKCTERVFAYAFRVFAVP